MGATDNRLFLNNFSDFSTLQRSAAISASYLTSRAIESNIARLRSTGRNRKHLFSFEKCQKGEPYARLDGLFMKINNFLIRRVHTSALQSVAVERISLLIQCSAMAA